MATIADIITEIRDELSDDVSSRWTDAKLLRLLGRTIRRAALILQKHGIQFAVETEDIILATGEYIYSLPNDFASWIALYNVDDEETVDHVTDDEWEQITNRDSLSECVIWRINKTDIEVAGTPRQEVNLRLYYWPFVSKDVTDAYTETDSTPWDGKLDDMLIDYCALRCKNIDEMDITVDTDFLRDFEERIVMTYRPLGGARGYVEGWL
jgi:hypothetical protein